MICTNILQTGDNKTTDYRNQIWIWDKRETDVDLGHQDVAMLLVGQLLCHRCHQFFLGEKEAVLMGIEGPPPSPKTPSPHQSVPEKINLLPKRRISLPTPPHFSGANSLLVWGFGSCWLMRKNQMACLSSYRSQVFGWEKATNRCITLGPQQPMEKWRFYTTDIWVITYNP